MLKGPGFRLQRRPKVLNCFVGMTRAQPWPMGQAIIWAIREPRLMEGDRSEKTVFIEAPRKMSDMPMVQARTVLQGKSSS